MQNNMLLIIALFTKFVDKIFSESAMFDAQKLHYVSCLSCHELTCGYLFCSPLEQGPTTQKKRLNL